jgi:hypothetical protein
MDALRALDEEMRRTYRTSGKHRVPGQSRKDHGSGPSDEGRGHLVS